ncbi:hypothetical protein [Kitasatospora sp. NPDC101183]|uniref:hypothetical protein n=1 Tax=Kitasatospora sp. NPDC101183 TaxID=3364100 RepID=UPI00382334DA
MPGRRRPPGGGLQIPEPTHALGAMIDCHHAGRPFSITGTGYPTRDGSGIRDTVIGSG